MESNKLAERAPMLPTNHDLSLKNLEMMGRPGHYLDGFSCGAKWMRGIVEAKITSGELMVVNKATLIPRNGMKCCSVCDYRYEYYEELAPEPGDFCRCGSQITK